MCWCSVGFLGYRQNPKGIISGFMEFIIYRMWKDEKKKYKAGSLFLLRDSKTGSAHQHRVIDA